MPAVRIGTRPSKLAVKQAEMVARRLDDAGCQTEIVKISSTGDTDSVSPLYEMDRTGVFVAELNQNVLDRNVDVAVHSAKDLPSILSGGLEISGTLPRENFLDALVSRFNLESLPPGSRIGTSSIRRIHELKSFRPDLVAENIRGNIDTRIRKFLDGQYDGIIIAEAGIHRLGINIPYSLLTEDDFLPAPNQGIIAVVSRADYENADVIRKISHQDTMDILKMERKLMSDLNLGCSVPAGILCKKTEFGFRIRCRFYSRNSKEFKEFSRTFNNEAGLEELVKEITERVPAGYGYNFGKGL